MGKGASKNRSERLIRNKTFDPEQYGMVVCPVCKGIGYVQNPKRRCCLKCGGFAFIKKEKEACNNEGERDD
jgi:RecJ-like exonuclease